MPREGGEYEREVGLPTPLIRGFSQAYLKQRLIVTFYDLSPGTDTEIQTDIFCSTLVWYLLRERLRTHKVSTKDQCFTLIIISSP